MKGLVNYDRVNRVGLYTVLIYADMHRVCSYHYGQEQFDDDDENTRFQQKVNILFKMLKF